MSYVIVYADKSRTVIAGDGREMDSEGAIINNDVCRVEKLNESILAGFVGNLKFCQRMINKIKASIQTRNPEEKTCKVPEASRILKAAAITAYRPEYGSCSFVFSWIQRL